MDDVQKQNDKASATGGRAEPGPDHERSFWKRRSTIIVGSLALAVLLFFGGVLTYKGFGVVLAAGVVLLALSGRSDSEKKGYRF